MKFIPNQTLAILPAHSFLPHQFLPLHPFALDESCKEQHLIADSKWRRGAREAGGVHGEAISEPHPIVERDTRRVFVILRAVMITTL